MDDKSRLKKAIKIGMGLRYGAMLFFLIFYFVNLVSENSSIEWRLLSLFWFLVFSCLLISEADMKW